MLNLAPFTVNCLPQTLVTGARVSIWWRRQDWLSDWLWLTTCWQSVFSQIIWRLTVSLCQFVWQWFQSVQVRLRHQVTCAVVTKCGQMWWRVLSAQLADQLVAANICNKSQTTKPLPNHYHLFTQGPHFKVTEALCKIWFTDFLTKLEY